VTPAKARLFVALDLPEAVRGRVAGWARSGLGARDGLRLIAPAHLHVTLCFLGWRPEEEIAPLGEAVADCAAPVPQLGLGEAVWLPRRRPRLVALDLVDGSGALGGMHRRVSDALARRTGYEPEARPFRPHVTVARLRSGARVPASEPTGPEPPGGPAFDGAALTLYRSHLTREGARYEAVERVDL
jgi:2'-5' RNA ligase